MKRLILALTICFLMGSVSAPPQYLTAAPVGNSEFVAITQEPVDVVVPVEVVAKLVVEGPTKARLGQLVVISVENSDAKSFKWLTMPSTDNFLVIEDGRRIVFSSETGGEYKFVVACSLGDTCDVTVHTVKITGTPVTPVDSLASRIALYCGQVKSPTKRDDCLKLAQSFASVAMVVDGGSFTTPVEIVKATFNSNQEALGDRLDDWLPFREGLSKELKQLADAGKLTDTPSHVTVWKSIASALRDYAETL